MKVNTKGFTIIELLVVMGIISMLSTLVMVGLDPAKRFADARNATRTTDVNNIITAVHEYIVDNKGALPAGLSTGMVEKQIGTCTSGGTALCSSSTASCVDLSAPLAKYLKSLPTDKSNGTAVTTGYSISVDSNNIVTVKSCLAENGEVISISR